MMMQFRILVILNILQRVTMERDSSSGYTHGFDELFLTQPPEEYDCPICLYVSNQAVQTACGHRFCNACILKVIREGRPNCPVDNQDLDETQLFPDGFARKEISRLDVRCRNSTDDRCQWIGPLKDLASHMTQCTFAIIQCKNLCGIALSRQHMTEHLSVKCDKRVLNCRHCDMKVVHKQLSDHYNTCSGYPVDCPNACGKVPRDTLNDHLDNLCPNTIFKCMYKVIGCTFEGRREEMNAHTETSREKHTEKLIDAFLSLKMKFEMKNNEHVNTMNKIEIERLSDKVVELELDARNLKEQNIITMERNIEQLIQRVSNNEKTIEDVFARMWHGCIIWKITSFQEGFMQAQNGLASPLYSIPFYTAIPGYKICLRANLNGVDAGEGTHLSLFAHLMKGEYDDILEWPFRGDIIFTVMDQEAPGKANHVTETLTAHPSVKAFRRPTTSRNSSGYGYVKMVAHEQLLQNRYVQNDCILIRVEVKTV